MNEAISKNSVHNWFTVLHRECTILKEEFFESCSSASIVDFNDHAVRATIRNKAHYEIEAFLEINTKLQGNCWISHNLTTKRPSTTKRSKEKRKVKGDSHNYGSEKHGYQRADITSNSDNDNGLRGSTFPNFSGNNVSFTCLGSLAKYLPCVSRLPGNNYDNSAEVASGGRVAFPRHRKSRVEARRPPPLPPKGRNERRIVIRLVYAGVHSPESDGMRTCLQCPEARFHDYNRDILRRR
ncbi:hypothetical protein Trydic_g11671 [Trypoxylus dichotomus]